MDSYVIYRDKDVIHVKFNKDDAQNDEIVKDACSRLDQMAREGELSGGGLIKINGPASLPVAAAISYRLAQYFSAISIFDPKMDRYVIVISNDPQFTVGDLIEISE
ncbi:MAG: hypothetical protein A4E35_00849 [Methanoregula sp. PtaU1.Bin051]|nr:MAG: hypothetical protein A4E35_00849 [Methanoregula sp. PtaU1.Bin051]